MYYELVIQPDYTEDGTSTWLITSPDFPEITTFGETQQEACENGLRAIEEAIAARISDGDTVPVPTKETKGKSRWVELPLLSALKIALYLICKDKEISRADLARLLKWHREQVERLFRLDHRSQLDQIEAAFKAIGEPLSFDVPGLNAA